MNKVILIGRLTSDPEVRYAQNENATAVAKFSIAVDRRGQEGADFPSIVAFGRTAEFIEKYFHKGMRIALDGKLQTGSYTNKDGVKVYTTDVVAENVEFCEKKETKEEAPKNPADGFMNVPEGIDEDELPFARR